MLKRQPLRFRAQAYFRPRNKLVKLLGAALGKNPSLIHQGDSLETGGFVHVGCGNQHGDAALPHQGRKDSPEIAPRDWIDTGCGLVKNQQFRLVYESAASTIAPTKTNLHSIRRLASGAGVARGPLSKVGGCAGD